VTRAAKGGPFPLVRNVAGLDSEFDLLVVGGGIYGAWTAYDAALRGLKVALVEK
jgi:glycerol-3-phosphate dehydrogenase